MKRTLIALLTLLFLFDVNVLAMAEATTALDQPAVVRLAQANTPDSDTRPDKPAAGASAESEAIKILIERSLSDNYAQIQSRAAALDLEQRQQIFSDTQKEPIIGFLLNFLVGLGIGSFVLGDNEGGMTELIGEAAGSLVAAIGIGLGVLFAAGNGRTSPVSIVMLLVGIAGIVTAAVYRVGGWIRPFSYSDSFNKELKNALGLGESTQGLSPYYQGFTDTSGQTWHEAGLAYRFSF